MKTALIGYTGFVGSNIAAKYEFDDYYNSKNINQIRNKEYDLVVSAANGAEMWRINNEPEKDLANINEFINHVSGVKIKKFVLISSVGVYKITRGINEDTPIDTDGLTPYGKNRYYLEQWCRKTFDTTIVRLPGLYGKGLKKNVIFDLLNNNNLDKVHKDGVYQYYDLSHLWKDINIALDNNLELVNMATPPISTEEVANKCFMIEFSNAPKDLKPAYWDMQSKYSSIYGGQENYLYTKEQELAGIKSFVESQKKS